MAWLAVDKDKREVILDGYKKPRKNFMEGKWYSYVIHGDVMWNNAIHLPKGTIKKLIGRDLTWRDEPVEL